MSAPEQGGSPKDSFDPYRKNAMGGAAGVAGAGLQFALTLIVFVFLGHWLDGRLGTGPWLLMLGVIIGAGGGFYAMYRRLMAEQAREERERAERRKAERDRGGS